VLKVEMTRFDALVGGQQQLMAVLSAFLIAALVILVLAIVGLAFVDMPCAWSWTSRLLIILAGFGLGLGPAYVVCQAARSTRTLVALALLLAASLVLGSGESHAAAPAAPKPAEAWPVEASFRQAIQLWADERFDALWEHGLLASRYQVSREAFARWMRHRVVKPTCCWGQIRGVRVHLQTADEVLVEAQVGFDVKTLGTTVVRSLLVYLRRDEGEWRVRLEDFMTKPEAGLPWDWLGPG
jgi:hypothetical protein